MFKAAFMVPNVKGSCVFLGHFIISFAFIILALCFDKVSKSTFLTLSLKSILFSAVVASLALKSLRLLEAMLAITLSTTVSEAWLLIIMLFKL
mmetsp:Transcript_28166/g.50384  ORF Transcript_28166/g.50384 Transcript_28166/m.50384 type:complete len:93 (-) Transcript_28166:76-354(-)